ncbi:hypothetical protein BDV18DRAFT_158824 [Aspergillus unguis]
MAPSLRDLIDFLLAEIALCGSQGASPADILSFIGIFYAKVAKNDSGRTPVIDRRFQEKVWQWLIRNPEVHVGKDREWNSLSLEEAESRQLGEGDSNGEAQDSPSSAVKVFVSEKRTWLAITGHERDDTKVLPMEFALLSIIASRKSAGMTQPELIRLSGQDKRSVPKRTDVLQQKGYIEKRAIQIKAARTSLCTLRQFLAPDAIAAEASAATAETDSSKIIDFKLFTNRLFEILREHKIIARNDLKDTLGFNDHWRWRVLSRALRKFERIGVLKRVRAMSQYANTMKKYHPCVMLVREPTDKDIEDFHDFSISIYSDMKQSEDAGFEDDAEAEDAGEPSGTDHVKAVGSEGDVEVSGRVLPSWSPDRNIHNQLFEAIDRTGTMGSTNNDVIRTCFGVFYRRPLENTLARLSECWQLSQPPHLRHLALVRDTALQRTITHYVHYSAENFSKLVEAGESSWEAVEFVPKHAKAAAVPVPPVHAKPQLDVYGLPMDNPASELVKNGDCTLTDCMLVVKPKDYNCSSSDPKAVKTEDGTYMIQYWIKGVSGQSSSARQSTPDTPVRFKVEDEGDSNIATEEPSTPVLKRPKKSKMSSIDLTGMSEKEKLEAMGMDETWAEYKVLLMERPGPGVYVTARGKRRPAGKERGRPPASRIAVFKSPRLQEISWFAQDREMPNNGDAAAHSPRLATANPVSAGPTAPPISNAVRGTKRSNQRESHEGESERVSKMPRTGDVENGHEKVQGSVAEDVSSLKEAETQTTPRTRGKRKRTVSPETEGHKSSRGRKRAGKTARSMVEDSGQPNSSAADESGHVSGTQGDRARRGSRNTGPDAPEPPSSLDHVEKHSQQNEEAQMAQVAHGNPANNNAVLATPVRTKAGPSAAHKASSKPVSTPAVNGTPASLLSPTPDTSAVKSAQSRYPEKGGTVALLRRKIVLDLIEKAGGAFPMGTELWYPFVTAWMKTKYKERPDMRTLRTAVKHLVDAGKLRQQTFCGKDKKGIMVTKTIVCKSSLPPDDPFIKDMQEKILTTDARHFFPPGVEVDPNLTKQGSTPKPPKAAKNASMIPVERSMTVQLHQKPAAVQAIERRRGQAVQRRLNDRMDIERMRQSMQEIRPSGVVRLLSLQRPDVHEHGTPLDPMFGGFGKRGGREHRLFAGTVGHNQLKRLHLSLSLMTPHAMLMSPTQTFNPSNGTFSTNPSLAFILPKHVRHRATKPTMKSATILMMMHPAQQFNPNNGTFSTDAGLAAFTMLKAYHHRTSHKRGSRLPHSLDDQLMQARRRNVQLPGETDTRSADFIRDTNAILRWELQNESLLQQRSDDMHYINQGIKGSFESAPIKGGIRFGANALGSETMPPSANTIRRRRRRQVPGPGSEGLEDMPTGSFILEDHPPFRPPPPAAEYYPDEQPPPRRIEKLNQMMAGGSEYAPLSQDKPQFRRNRTHIPFSSSAYQRLMAAIVAVRTLAGGADGRMIDWSLVPYCFPDQDPKLVQDKGRTLLAKNRLQIAKMQSDFQERFIDAYANDEVPPIDYNNLEGYDWDAVIEWINANLDVPKSDSTMGLPATREQFDEIFEIREDPVGTLDEIYSNQAMTLNRKRMLITNIAFAAPLPAKSSRHRAHRHQDLSKFETLKTWVRANVFTPAEVYRASDARYALAHIDNGQLNSALQSLVTERVILQANKGRPIPGRNYDISEYFIQTLGKKRPVEATEIRRAAKFKVDTLDAAFAEQGVYNVPFGGEDGDFLALINLFSEGRIRLVPRDPPREKFGLTEGGYLTRMINKDKLRFPIDVRPVPGKYVNGNPVSEKVSQLRPPCPPRITVNSLSLPEKFPLWYDIHGNVIKVLWELSVAAVLGTVALRPGITPKKVAGMIKPTMSAWEVLMVLEWLAEAGVMRRRGDDTGEESCWYTMEWWWMVL